MLKKSPGLKIWLGQWTGNAPCSGPRKRGDYEEVANFLAKARFGGLFFFRFNSLSRLIAAVISRFGRVPQATHQRLITLKQQRHAALIVQFFAASLCALG
jgi:hypothetical protein